MWFLIFATIEYVWLRYAFSPLILVLPLERRYIHWFLGGMFCKPGFMHGREACYHHEIWKLEWTIRKHCLDVAADEEKSKLQLDESSMD